MLNTLRLLALAASVLAGATAAQTPVVVRHMLWDSAQKPAYQQCANRFERSHPGVRIRIVQQGWDDYWGTLSTGFVADTAPDVFTAHLTKFAEQVENGVLLDLQPLITRDGVKLDHLDAGLLRNWQRERAGRTEQYALPADWDTVALVVNLDVAQRAGVSLAELQNLSWNPRDGGSLGQVAARMTFDKQGRNALSPGFDKRQVQVFGYQVPGSGGMFGQSEWSFLAVSNGFKYQPTPWQGPLRYDDPALVDTLAWLASLSGRGISASPESRGKLGAEALFATGRAAIVPTGSWMLSYFARNARFPFAFVPTPIGPSGQRATMRNGLAHTIWRGTRHPEQAWAWLQHLASTDCQTTVAQAGVVYPAARGTADLAAQVQRKLGVDPSAFLDMVKAGTTFAPPIIDHSAQINDLIDEGIEQVLLGAPAGPAMRAANAKANAVLRR